MEKQINQPLANVINRCIRNSPDSETKRREVAKLKAMFPSEVQDSRSEKSVLELMEELFA